MTPRSITIAVWEFWARAFIWKRTTPSALSGCAFRASVVDVPYAEGNKNYGATSAPLIVKDKVLVELPVATTVSADVVAAYDAETGKLAWRSGRFPGPGSLAIQAGPVNSISARRNNVDARHYDRNSIQFLGGTSNPAPDFDGGPRPGRSLH